MAGFGNHRDVGFMEAVPLAFRNFANFKDRSSRGAYWWFVLANLIISFVLGFIDGLVFGASAAGFGVLSGLWALAVLIPSLSLGFRRLHDTGKSAWWLLIALIPLVGAIVLLVFFAGAGQREGNEYGPDAEAGRPDTGAIDVFS